MNPADVPVVAGLVCCMLAAAPASAEKGPESAAVAIRALLAVTDQPIARGSSCFANYGQRDLPRVKDMLASRLAYLHSGDNAVLGECRGSRCEIEIRHSAGEDVASARISFTQRRGRADVRSLQCLMTP